MSSRREKVLLVCAVLSGLGGATTILDYFDISPGGVAVMPPNMGSAITAIALYCFTVFAAIYFWRRLQITRANLQTEQARLDVRYTLTILKSQCEGLLHQYKHMNNDHPEKVKYPINESSWPRVGERWYEVHLKLVTARAELDTITNMAKVLWSRANWQSDQVQMFSMGASTKMLDLIEALERFIKIKPQPQTKSQ